MLVEARKRHSLFEHGKRVADRLKIDLKAVRAKFETLSETKVTEELKVKLEILQRV